MLKQFMSDSDSKLSGRYDKPSSRRRNSSNNNSRTRAGNSLRRIPVEGSNFSPS